MYKMPIKKINFSEYNFTYQCHWRGSKFTKECQEHLLFLYNIEILFGPGISKRCSFPAHPKLSSNDPSIIAIGKNNKMDQKIQKRDLGNTRAIQTEMPVVELITISRYFCIAYWEEERQDFGHHNTRNTLFFPTNTGYLGLRKLASQKR